MIRQLVLALAFLAVAGVARAGIFEDTLAAYGVGPEQAVVVMRPLAEDGLADAQYFMGFAYGEGRGVAQNYAVALDWLLQAAEQGFAPAQYRVGIAFEFGQAVPRDLAEAAAWYEIAAMGGDAEAQTRLAGFLELGVGVPRNLPEAVRYYRMAAEQGALEAQRGLVRIYMDGAEGGGGGLADLAEGARWQRLAAEQGGAGDQFVMGLLYVGGLGVSQDYAEAAHWYGRSAEQGYPPAQNALGELYRDGLGVPVDLGEAIRLFRQSMAAGSDQAQFNLGLAYLDGVGVDPDSPRPYGSSTEPPRWATPRPWSRWRSWPSTDRDSPSTRNAARNGSPGPLRLAMPLASMGWVRCTERGLACRLTSVRPCSCSRPPRSRATRPRSMSSERCF